MSLAVVYSRAQSGLDAPLVTVEVHLSSGLPSLSIVGLPEAAVKESKDRVRSALINNQFEFPLKRITINLAPADLPKEGGRFDLPIALGILAASGQIADAHLHDYEFVGELALTGALRPVRGALTIANATKNAARALVLPAENAAEAALVSDIKLYSTAHLLTLCAQLNGTQTLTPWQRTDMPQQNISTLCMSDIHAQAQAKRALEIAAAGRHNLLFVGGPGVGKTMLAQRLPSILPAMSEQEAMESAAVASVSRQGFQIKNWRQRMFRSPHHTASGIALVGGGSNPRPGEISLAHHGVLFLDEFPEFDRKVLEVLREPLENGYIAISRAYLQVEFPADFQLVAAMNPCPCGYLGETSGRCHCTETKVQQYRHKISGPLLDRIDLHIEVPNIPKQVLLEATKKEETSFEIQQRVAHAYAAQLQRSGICNKRLQIEALQKYCKLDDTSKTLLTQAIDRMGLSARAIHSIQKVARTIADLAGSDEIKTAHLGEAITLRMGKGMGL